MGAFPVRFARRVALGMTLVGMACWSQSSSAQMYLSRPPASASRLRPSPVEVPAPLPVPAGRRYSVGAYFAPPSFYFGPVTPYGNPYGYPSPFLSPYGAYPPFRYGNPVDYGLNSYSPYLDIDSQRPTMRYQPAPLRDEYLRGQQRWNTPLSQQPIRPTDRPLEKAATPEAQLRSLRFQQHGDQQVKAGQIAAASGSYRQAVNAAPDRPEPHFHWGIALLARRQFTEAVQQFRTGIGLDAGWPTRNPRFTEFFGDDQPLVILQLKDQAAQWVQQDIRDSNRVFLLGLVLLLDGDTDRSREVIGTAARLAANPDWMQPFLGAAPAMNDPALPLDMAPAPPNEIPRRNLPRLPANPAPPEVENSDPLPEAPLPNRPQPRPGRIPLPVLP